MIHWRRTIVWHLITQKYQDFLTNDFHKIKKHFANLVSDSTTRSNLNNCWVLSAKFYSFSVLLSQKPQLWKWKQPMYARRGNEFSVFNVHSLQRALETTDSLELWSSSCSCIEVMWPFLPSFCFYCIFSLLYSLFFCTHTYAQNHNVSILQLFFKGTHSFFRI